MQGNVEKEYAIYNAILKPYIGGDLVLNKKYSSPLPQRRDSTPSFSVREHKGRIVWKDFAVNTSGDKLVNLIMELNGISYKRACGIIERSDFPPIPIKEVKESEYRIKYSPLDYSEILWWGQYHIQPRTLKKYKVFGLRKMWKNTRLVYDSQYKPMTFVYLGETKDVYQIYQPKKRNDRKWMQRNGSFLLGFEMLPLTGQTLLIASGLKDGLCLYEAGVPFISGCGELDIRNIGKVLPELKLRFRSIKTLLDPDAAGRKATAVFQKELGIEPLNFPYPNSKEDIADLSKRFGINFIRQGLTY